MIRLLVVILITVVPLFGVSLFLIIGTAKGVKFLNEPSESYLNFYPYNLLKRIHPKATYYYHISVGVVLMAMSLVLLYYILSL